MEYYGKNDWRDYLVHGWGTTPTQKAKERKYNHEYYLKNKDRILEKQKRLNALDAAGRGKKIPYPTSNGWEPTTTYSNPWYGTGQVLRDHLDRAFIRTDMRHLYQQADRNARQEAQQERSRNAVAKIGRDVLDDMLQ